MSIGQIENALSWIIEGNVQDFLARFLANFGNHPG